MSWEVYVQHLCASDSIDAAILHGRPGTSATDSVVTWANSSGFEVSVAYRVLGHAHQSPPLAEPCRC